MRHWWGALFFVAACSGGVTAKASFLNGAGGTGGSHARFAPAVIPFGAPVIASPDKVTVTFTQLSLQQGFNGSGPSADLSDCVVTYDRSQASGSHLLDCEFSVDPGTYDTIRISYKTTLQVLIDDPVNNYYSDPTSPNLLSTVRPPNGAQPVDYMQSTGAPGPDAGFSIPLYPPVEITADSTAFSLIGDLNRTIQISDGSSAPTLTNPNHQIGEVVNLVAVPGATGSAEFYQDSATYVPTGDNTSKGLKIFYGPNGQPVTTIMPPGTCNWSGLGFGYEFGPSAVAMQTGTMFLYGAYLGMDTNKIISWEEPSLQGWSNVGLFEIKRASALGEMQTLQCQTTTNTPPSSGDTFASGAPAITPSTTLPLYLQAQ